LTPWIGVELNLRVIVSIRITLTSLMDKEIVVKYFEGKATPDEEQALLAWINMDSSNFEYFMHERKLWDALLVNGYCEEPLNTLAGNFAKLNINKKEPSKQDSGSPKNRTLFSRRLMPLLRYAAVFLLGIIIYTALSHIVKLSNPVSWNEMAIPKGNRVRVMLPDSSVVWLNSESKFRYPANFETRKREVWLNGEAFFEVHKNPKQRFIVHTATLSVEAVGTSFNVLAYDNDSIFETALVTGKVNILYGHSDIPAKMLDPMELAVYNKTSNSLNVHHVDVEYYTCWKNGEFKFRNERLEVIAHKLERYYNLKIEFGSNEIKDYRLTGTFPVSESWEKILTVIEKTTGAHCSLHKHVAVFEKAKSPGEKDISGTDQSNE
jgi:transmembrane sensor